MGSHLLLASLAALPLAAPGALGGAPPGVNPARAASPAHLADAGLPPTPAGTASADTELGPLPLTATLWEVGGREGPLPHDGGQPVDVGASFRIELAVPLVDGRLALHDEQDAMVASTGTSEVGGAWTRYRLTPREPLRPGTRYLLRVDGTAARAVHDSTGHAFAPLALRFTTAGERPAATPARQRRKGKR